MREGREFELEAEVAELRAVIAQHDLCHNLHGKVDAVAFAEGCASEQRKLYGCAPHADHSLAPGADYAVVPRSALLALRTYIVTHCGEGQQELLKLIDDA